jgi:hypothetical protein
MNKFKILLLFTCCISACTSLTTINSLPAHNLSETNKLSNYDSKGKVSYCVFNDSTNLHIQLITSDRSAIRKILYGGLSIYFDTCGKKKKDTFVHYPLPKSSKMHQSQGLTLSEQLIFLPKEAIFQNNNEQHTFNTLHTKDSIQVNITSNSTHQLSYHLKIPFECLSKSGIQACKNLSIGIETGSINSSPINKQPSNFSSPMRQGKGMGHINGPRSGRGRQMTANSQPNRSTLTIPVEIWHKIILK